MSDCQIFRFMNDPTKHFVLFVQLPLRGYCAGYPKKQKTWSRVVGYVEQFDVHSPTATVREALEFSSRLRLDACVKNDKAVAVVDEVLEITDLSDLQNSIVGIPGLSGLSVEQRKRLSIANELVANPRYSQ